MTLILDGVRVLEVAEYGMVPSAGSVLGEWGADVVKVEHAHRGDPIRGLTTYGLRPGFKGFTAMWEPFNRNKRGIGVDIAVPQGREIVLKLAERADVFITSFLPAARKKLGIDVADLRAVNPRLIYARGSAHGQKGPEAEAGGFDGLTYWHRGGIGATVSRGMPGLVHQPGPGFGDIQVGMTMAGGIAAALYHRERTGEALEVDTSLLAQAAYAMSGTLVVANLMGMEETPRMDRKQLDNPLSNAYCTQDGRWVMLGMMQGDRYWPGLCAALGRPELATDPRFADMAARSENRVACTETLDELFGSMPLKEIESRLESQDGPYSVAQRVGDLNHDQQAWANGYLQDVDYGDGRHITLGSAPVQFDGEIPTITRAPEHGEHTEQVLLEAGYDWDDIARLRDSTAIA